MLISTALVLLFWVVLTLDRRRRWPAETVLPTDAGGGAVRAAQVAAIVPARDEADVLPLTLPSLLRQPELGLVVLVDDSSADDTAATARELARELGAWAEQKLVVVSAPLRPPGWSGKVHAQAVGLEAIDARGLEPEWLLLSDADIRHRVGTVASLLAVAHRGPRDLVSVMARLRCVSFWERLLIPPFVYFFQLLYPFRLVADDASRVGAAAGGCVLVRRAVLTRAGGFETIREALIDDVALGRAVKRAGGRLWLGLDVGIESVRSYPRLSDVWGMVARNAFDQLRYSWLLLAVVVLGMTILFVAPPVAAAGLGLAFIANGEPGVALAAALAATAWLLQSLHVLGAVRHHGLAVSWAAALPAASLFYALMTVSSAFAHLGGRTSTWRGRTYDRRGEA